MDNVRKREMLQQIRRGPRRALAVLTDEMAGAGQQDPDVAYLIGVANYRLGDFPSAEGAFRKAISLNPENAEALYYLGLSTERQGHRQVALQAYRAAAAQDPNLSLAQNKLRSFGEGAAPRPPLAAPPPPSAAPPPPRAAPPQQRDTSLVLPDTEEEFRDFERRIRRRELIETRAQNAAMFPGLPWWVKLLVAIMAILLIIGAVDQILVRVRGDDPAFTETQAFVCERGRELGNVLPGCSFSPGDVLPTPSSATAPTMPVVPTDATVQAPLTAQPATPEPKLPARITCTPMSEGPSARIGRGDEVVFENGADEPVLLDFNQTEIDGSAIEPGQSHSVSFPDAGTFEYNCSFEAAKIKQIGTVTVAADSATPAGTTYVVQPGDTLFSIGRRNNVTVEDILSVNPEITDPNELKVGQEIIIPAP